MPRYVGQARNGGWLWLQSPASILALMRLNYIEQRLYQLDGHLSTTTKTGDDSLGDLDIF